MATTTILAPAVTDTGALPPTFTRLWVATLTSSLGDGLVLVAFGLLALTVTHAPVLIASVAAAAQLPAFLLAPLVGAVVDRADRRRLATLTEVVRLAVFATFAVAVAGGHDAIWLIDLTAAVLGICEVLFISTVSAALPQMVPHADLEVANGRLTAAELTAREIAGQGVGGVVYALSHALPFALDAASFLVSALLIRRALPHGRVAEDPRAQPVRRDIADGMRWFGSHALVRGLAGVIGTFALCQGAVHAVLVLYATSDLHTGTLGYGLLLAVGSVGAAAGALVAGRVVRRIGPWACVALGGTAGAIAYGALSVAPSFGWAAGAVVLESAGVTLGNVASLSLRQRAVPNELLGRVGTTFRMVLLGAVVLGAVLGGVATQLVGVRAAFAGAGVLQALVVIIATVRGRWRQGVPAVRTSQGVGTKASPSCPSPGPLPGLGQ